jgi:Patatin-like phospholipase
LAGWKWYTCFKTIAYSQTVDEVIESYKAFAKKIFTSTSKNPRAKFDHEILEQEVKEVIKHKNLDPQVPLENPNPNACKTFIVATNTQASGTPVLMRAYNNFPSVEAFPAMVWQAACATMTAPMFFLPILINNIEYSDGSTGFNNPTELAIDEAHSIWPNRPIGCLVSIGTGLEDAIRLGSDTKGLAHTLLSISSAKADFNINVAKWCVALLTSSHSKHLQLKKQAKRLGINEAYFRFDVPQGMSRIGLADWDQLNDMIALTEPYMTYDKLEEKESVAKRLLNPNIAS